MRKKIEKDLRKSPMLLCGQNMKQTKELKYLGDFISPNLADSVHTTVMKRVVVAKQTIVDIRKVIEDTRANRLGAMTSALDIWQLAVLPMVLANSESWLNISKKTLRVLDELFNNFSQKMWRVSSGCPRPSFYWQTGCMKFSHLILCHKLIFIHHVANQSESS